MKPLRLISAGKGSVLSGAVQADLYLDCRVMVNPFRDPVLGGLTGDSPQVQAWVRTNNAGLVSAFTLAIKTGLATAATRNSGKDPAKPFTVCFFCLAGVHRSRGMKHVIGQDLASEGLTVEIVN